MPNLSFKLHFSFLTVPGLGQGYLSELSYLPDWDGLFSDMTDAQFSAFTDGNVEEYYEDVYDRFNDPDTGTDAAIKGKLYPKSITMPVAYQDAEVWMKVYVPIMESIKITGITVTNVLGCGMQKGSQKYYRGAPVEMNLLPKVKAEIAVCAVPVNTVIDAAKAALYTGNYGDGKLFIYDIENVVKIRTGEQDYDALQDSQEENKVFSGQLDK